MAGAHLRIHMMEIGITVDPALQRRLRGYVGEYVVVNVAHSDVTVDIINFGKCQQNY